MTRTRLIFLIRLTTLAVVLWILGMPLPVIAAFTPVALMMPAFATNPCSAVCTALNNPVSVSISGITAGSCGAECLTFNAGWSVTIADGCNGSTINTSFLCGGFAPTGDVTVGVSDSGGQVIVSVTVNSSGDFAVFTSAGQGATPQDCSAFGTVSCPFQFSTGTKCTEAAATVSVTF